VITLSPEVEILGQRKETIFLRTMENGSADQVIVTANQDGKKQKYAKSLHSNLANFLVIK